METPDIDPEQLLGLVAIPHEQLVALVALLIDQRRQVLEIFMQHMTPLERESAIEHLECVFESSETTTSAPPLLPTAPCVLAPPAD